MEPNWVLLGILILLSHFLLDKVSEKMTII
jgi:hypothetical protein